jgi:hypothetical protein
VTSQFCFCGPNKRFVSCYDSSVQQNSQTAHARHTSCRSHFTGNFWTLRPPVWTTEATPRWSLVAQQWGSGNGSLSVTINASARFLTQWKFYTHCKIEQIHQRASAFLQNNNALVEQMSFIQHCSESSNFTTLGTIHCNLITKESINNIIYLHLLGRVLQNQMCQGHQMLPSTCCNVRVSVLICWWISVTNALPRTEINYTHRNNFCLVNSNKLPKTVICCSSGPNQILHFIRSNSSQHTDILVTCL